MGTDCVIIIHTQHCLGTMTIIGPFASQKNGATIWLQITLAIDGVCAEFKQASEVDMPTNNWTLIEPDQWPTVISAYDPSVSQKHYILTTDSTGTLSRYYITKITPPKTDAQTSTQTLKYHVTSQTHTGNHFTPSVLLKDEEKKTKILHAQWIPDADTQELLKGQYQAWETCQPQTWHTDENHPELNRTNRPFDFQNTDRGMPKAPIENTQLNPRQQWIVQSVITDGLATIKSESSTSEEYRAALQFLIDRTQLLTPFSKNMQQNITNLQALCSITGINQSMKKNFYIKVDPQDRTQYVHLQAEDLGYQANIGSVIFYIQQILTAEIQQYFPDYLLNDQKICLATSLFQVGKLPSTEGIIDEATGLGRRDIAYIDAINRLFAGTFPLDTASDDQLTDLYRVMTSIQQRLAETEAIASMLPLLYLDVYTETEYESKLQSIATQIQQTRLLKQLFTALLSPGPNPILSSLSMKDSETMTSDLSVVLSRIQTYTAAQQIQLLQGLFQSNIFPIPVLINLLFLVDKETKKLVFDAIVQALPAPGYKQFQHLYTALNKGIKFDLDTPENMVQPLAAGLTAFGPHPAQISKFFQLTEGLFLPRRVRINNVRKLITAYYLSKQLNEFLNSEYSEQKVPELLALLPSISSQNQAAVIHAIQNLSTDNQIIILSGLFNNPEKFDDKGSLRAQFFLKFSCPTLDRLKAMVLDHFNPTDTVHYAQLKCLICKPIRKASATEKVGVRDILETAFPLNGDHTRIGMLLEITHGPGVMTEVYNTNNALQGRLLAKQFSQMFQDRDISTLNERLAAVLPNLNKGTHREAIRNGVARLDRALQSLLHAERTQLLVILLNTQNLSSSAAREIFGASSTLGFEEYVAIINDVSEERTTSLRDETNILLVLRNFFKTYRTLTQQTSLLTILAQFSDEFLDKLSPKISPASIQEWLDRNYNRTIDPGRKFRVDQLPTAHTTDWEQTLKTVSAAFLRTTADATFIQNIMTQKTPYDLKVLLLSEIENGSSYDAHYFVAIGFQRIAEHEAAIVQNLNPEERQYHTQLKSCGILGQHLMTELQCLRQNGPCKVKINRIQTALQYLPENLTLPILKEQLQQPNSALAKALVMTAKPPRTGRSFGLFEQNNPPPDFAILAEIKHYIAHDPAQITQIPSAVRGGR